MYETIPLEIVLKFLWSKLIQGGKNLKTSNLWKTEIKYIDILKF